MTYRFDHAWADERRRLAQIESTYDPWTKRTIETSELEPGAKCLEVGAGGGSIAEWLSRRVGATGHVVATDVETKFLEAIDARNLEVRRHDVVSEDLEDRHYDLVHARAVLEHLPEPDRVLARLADALRPGGWLVVEAGDFSTLRALAGEPAQIELFRSGFDAVMEASRGLGMDPLYGRRLGEAMRACGLEQVQLEGLVLEWNGDHPLASLYELTCRRLRGAILDRELLTDADLDRFLDLIRSPGSRALSHTIFSARGRRPTNE